MHQEVQALQSVKEFNIVHTVNKEDIILLLKETIEHDVKVKSHDSTSLHPSSHIILLLRTVLVTNNDTFLKSTQHYYSPCSISPLIILIHMLTSLYDINDRKLSQDIASVQLILRIALTSNTNSFYIHLIVVTKRFSVYLKTIQTYMVKNKTTKKNLLKKK
ncbi:hypothetical protein KSF78_0002102 [Schistosoma japonicum]|nr:hypothetical protein KSF78_0002102 [Schistosoma japonicum]